MIQQNQNQESESRIRIRTRIKNQNQNQNQESLNPARNQMIQQNQNQNQSWEEFIDSAKFQPPQTQPPTQFIAGINQNQAGTNPFQAGLDLSERGRNQTVPEVVQVDMVELINETSWKLLVIS